MSRFCVRSEISTGILLKTLFCLILNGLSSIRERFFDFLIMMMDRAIQNYAAPLAYKAMNRVYMKAELPAGGGTVGGNSAETLLSLTYTPDEG